MIRALRSASILALVLVACKKGDNVPSYIDVNAVSLSTTTGQGSATSNVTDAWVYANDELLGCWELPARIPVLKEGPVTIRVTPGVKRNGMFDERVAYPFYAAWLGQAELAPTVVTTLAPTVQYTAPATFWIESFEDPGTLFNLSEVSDTTLLRFTPDTDPDVVLDDTPCGGFVLEPAKDHILVYTDEDFTTTGGPVFLELDYRNDIQFTVGVIYTLDGSPHADPYVYVEPGGLEWKKMYIDLSPVFNTGITQRDIYIAATLPSGQASGRVYLDNIKLVR